MGTHPRPVGPEPDDLRQQLLEEVTRLPVGQEAGVRLLWMLADDDCDAASIGHAVETDPALTLQVMRIANSPFYGLSRQVSSARYAVTVLGTTMVRALAAAQVFRLNVRDARSLPPSFWEHSFATAAAAANLAVGRGVETSDAFSAGMLLDVGAALLRRNDPSRYAVVEQLARIPDESLIDAERRMFAIDHAEVGAFALDRLHFPRTFCTAVGEHHLLPSFRSSPLARVLFLAELVSHMVDGTPQESPITLGAAFEYLGEEPAQAELLVERARETLDSLGPLTDLLAA
ncbi:MAG TPA: HDOD domain-containing protein [Acidimicrobiia bacterium]|nr:HDOD domain-containing protein [Acidimicrobiia bacterium]